MALSQEVKTMSELSDDWGVPQDWWVMPDKQWEGGVDPTSTRAQDPYFWWFMQSGPLSMLDAKAWPQRIYFSAERNLSCPSEQVADICKNFHLSIPKAYDGRRYMTFYMDVQALRESLWANWSPPVGQSDEIAQSGFEGSVAEKVFSLQYAECFHRLAMGIPVRDLVPTEPPPDTSHANDVNTAPSVPKGTAPDVVLGLIDDGLPYLHAALRNSSGTGSRMLWIWDQRWSAPSSHTTFAGASSFGYGAVSVSTEIDNSIGKLLRQTSTEASEYAQHGFTDMRRRNSHGAAVLQLLAGDSSVCGPSAPMRWPTKQTSALPVIGVQIPFRQSSRRSLAGWLAVHVIDGMNFIAEQAKSLSATHLYVNLSLGAYGGPHDGSAIVDGAIDELVAKSAPTQVQPIAATGNTAGTRRNPSNWSGPRLPSGVHARGTWKKDRPLIFTLRVPPDKAEDTFLEIWFDQELPLRAPIKVSLEGPDGRVIEQKSFFSRSRSNSISPSSAPNETRIEQHGILFFRKVSQSRSEVKEGTKWRSMVLIALAPTRRPENGRRCVPPGDWTVTLAFDGSIKSIEGIVETVQDYRVDAWVERDDTWVGSRRGQQARLINAHGEQAAVTDENTFTSLAHGNSVMCAGAIDGTTREASPYSAEHRAGWIPSYSAVADRSPLRRGVLVGGTHSGTMRFASGTSMAAPQVVRSLANIALNASAWAEELPAPGVPDAKKGLELP
ncbi:MAG: hypothetical protein C4K60_00155 [Ideonella sp. MAG2]|nr:MAG: hypothetical protein C4K60_00155 [Ideonella sp. MAG2]